MNNNTSKHTIAGEPPMLPRAQRRSIWTEVFDEGRAHPGEWRRVARPMSKSTASQIASDIRNATHRDPARSRLRGLRHGDRWETQWGKAAGVDSGEYFVWITYVGSAIRVAV
jgi:hypothetical protein